MLVRDILQTLVDSSKSFVEDCEKIHLNDTINRSGEDFNDYPGAIHVMIPPTLTAISFPYLNLKCR